MIELSLYEELRKKHYLFTVGKRPQVLQAVCERIEGRIGKKPLLTQRELARKYNVTEASIRNYEDHVMLRLGFSPEDFPHRGKDCYICPYFLAYHQEKNTQKILKKMQFRV